jgi:ADP-heptose:LPS heptosyltransferase
MKVGRGCTYEAADYRLPVPDAWKKPALTMLARDNPTKKPVLVYRPLVARPEWRGGEQRNADPMAYAELFASIRDRFYVVSVADLEPGKEWIIGPRLITDKEFHGGELVFEHLAGLFSVADLVFTSSGFGAVLAPAVGTPVISIIGGYERAKWHESGARFAPYLAIEPVTPCSCSTSVCGRTCRKGVDMPAARTRIESFMTSLGFPAKSKSRALQDMFLPDTLPPPPPPPPPPAQVNAALMRSMYPPSRKVGLKA